MGYKIIYLTEEGKKQTGKDYLISTNENMQCHTEGMIITDATTGKKHDITNDHIERIERDEVEC